MSELEAVDPGEVPGGSRGSVSIQVCELHEVSNCSICTGLDKRLQTQEHRRGRPRGGGHYVRFERLPPGSVHASYPGRCGNCGVWFEAGEPIRYSDEAGGWLSMDCCG